MCALVACSGGSTPGYLIMGSTVLLIPQGEEMEVFAGAFTFEPAEEGRRQEMLSGRVA